MKRDLPSPPSEPMGCFLVLLWWIGLPVVLFHVEIDPAISEFWILDGRHFWEFFYYSWCISLGHKCCLACGTTNGRTSNSRRNGDNEIGTGVTRSKGHCAESDLEVR